MTSLLELAKTLRSRVAGFRKLCGNYLYYGPHEAAQDEAIATLIGRLYSGEGVELETSAEVKAELSRLLAKARSGPWHSDCERTEGSYGSGEDIHEGFDSFYVLDAENRRVVDTLNSDGTVEVEYDEDGTHAWDEAGRQSVELIVLLRNECGPLLADNDTLLALLAAEREAHAETKRQSANIATGVLHTLRQPVDQTEQDREYLIDALQRDLAAEREARERMEKALEPFRKAAIAFKNSALPDGAIILETPSEEYPNFYLRAGDFRAALNGEQTNG